MLSAFFKNDAFRGAIIDPKVFFATLAAALLFLAFILALVASHTLGLSRPLGSSLGSARYILLAASLASLIIIIVQQRFGIGSRLVFLALALTVLSVINAVDLTTQFHFSESILHVAGLIPAPEGDAATLATLWSVFEQYVSPSYVLLSLIFLAPVFVGFYLFGAYRLPILAPVILLATISVASFHILPSVASAIYSAKRLQKVDRADALIPLVGKPRFKPATIVLILNENTSYFSPSAQDNEISLRERIINLSGDPESWIDYSHAVTNSSSTDVSQPSIFTGAGTHESYAKLHKMPFLFDMAKARGYTTAFYTSQTLEWAKLARFFSAAKIDFQLSASTSGMPVINDLGVDDVEIMQRLGSFIRSRGEDDLFIVAGTNALHTPYQTDSQVPIPDTLKDRKQRGTYILEQAHKTVFDALRETGRLEDALIIVTADHGAPKSDEQRAIPRVENYLEETLRVPFLIHMPANLPPEMRRPLQANADSLVANVDIAPTLADTLGIRLTEGLSYIGYSLFKRIPESRLSVATSTNEWRRWPREAVALVRKHERFVCRSAARCTYDVVDGDGSQTIAQEADGYRRYLREGLDLPIVGEVIARTESPELSF